MSRSAAPPSVSVTVRFFARYAELLGAPRVEIAVPPGSTVATLLAEVRRVVPGAERLPERMLCAVNLVHVLPTQVLRDGDEVAILPPLAGG